jgi:hypothetical protein
MDEAQYFGLEGMRELVLERLEEKEVHQAEALDL